MIYYEEAEKKVGIVARTYNTNFSGGGSRRIKSMRPTQAKSVRPYNKRAGSMVQSV
jgi:hypothetical protein